MCISTDSGCLSHTTTRSTTRSASAASPASCLQSPARTSATAGAARTRSWSTTGSRPPATTSTRTWIRATATRAAGAASGDSPRRHRLRRPGPGDRDPLSDPATSLSSVDPGDQLAERPLVTRAEARDPHAGDEAPTRVGSHRDGLRLQVQPPAAGVELEHELVVAGQLEDAGDPHAGFGHVVDPHLVLVARHGVDTVDGTQQCGGMEIGARGLAAEVGRLGDLHSQYGDRLLVG